MATAGLPHLTRRRDGIAVGIVADVRLYRDCLAAALARMPGLHVAWTAGDLDAAVAQAAGDGADVAAIDVATHDSLRIMRAMRTAAPALPIVAFAAQEVDREIIACAEAGAGGFVPCDATLDELVAAIAATARGEVRCSPRTAAVLFQRVASLGQLASAARRPVLTAREHDVLELLERGHSNKEIAKQLHIQVATVKNHVHSVLEKLEVGTRGEAIAKQRHAGRARPADLPDALRDQSRT